MKRILHHPSGPANGRTYWRSLGEYARTPDFEEWLHREFPAGAAEWEQDPLSRRNFLRLMGASLALAGLGLGGCRRPEAHLVPFTQSPEWLISGKTMSFATAQPRRRGAVPLLATTFDGRPIKMEGNPLHPFSAGKSDNHAQASILDLYDPARRHHLAFQGKRAEAAQLDAEVQRLRSEATASAGATLAILADETCSPTRERLRTELLRQFPQATWAVYEPLSPGYDTEAATAAFGPGTQFRANLTNASTILAADCDFLGSEDGDLADTRNFAAARRVRKPGDKISRLYVAEPRFSITGSMADHRLRLRAGEVGAFLLELGRQIRGLRANAELNAALAAAPDLPLPHGVNPAWIRECAADLVASAGRSVVLVGRRQSSPIQALSLAINSALGAIGNTLAVQPAISARSTSIEDLASRMKAGAVKSLVILGGDPVYNAPADLSFASLLSTVPSSLHLAAQPNATSAKTSWFVPGTHYLESWGDALAADGSYLSIQPTIQPLWAGESQLEFLCRLAGHAKPIGPALIRETFAARTNQIGPALEQAWSDFVREGFLPSPPRSAATYTVNAAGVAALTAKIAGSSETSATSLEAAFVSSPAMDDGRYLNNGWLGLRNEIIKGILVADVVRATLAGQTVEAPILVAPGHVDFAVSLPLGYGQDELGPVAKGSGFNAYRIRRTDADYIAPGLKLEKTGRTRQLAVTQEHQVMEGRDLVREAAVDEFNQDPGWVKKGRRSPKPFPSRSPACNAKTPPAKPSARSTPPSIMRKASTSWPTTGASARGIAPTIARTRSAASTSSITTSAPSTSFTGARSPRKAPRRPSSCRKTRTSPSGCVALWKNVLFAFSASRRPRSVPASKRATPPISAFPQAASRPPASRPAPPTPSFSAISKTIRRRSANSATFRRTIPCWNISTCAHGLLILAVSAIRTPPCLAPAPATFRPTATGNPTDRKTGTANLREAIDARRQSRIPGRFRQGFRIPRPQAPGQQPALPLLDH
ncbi:MAG: hypothetical protein EBS49_01625 [Verrucomicrobia bacterium]|nr:hypothetical protein [Verrucomicrobiota bacterium]